MYVSDKIHIVGGISPGYLCKKRKGYDDTRRNHRARETGSGKTSATPACLSCTCEPHRCGGCPQFGYTGTGYLPPMQIQAVSLWPMFCRKAAVWSSGGKKELLPSRFQHQTFKCDTKPCRGHPIIYIFIQFIFQPIAMVIMIK